MEGSEHIASGRKQTVTSFGFFSFLFARRADWSIISSLAEYDFFTVKTIVDRH